MKWTSRLEKNLDFMAVFLSSTANNEAVYELANEQTPVPHTRCDWWRCSRKGDHPTLVSRTQTQGGSRMQAMRVPHDSRREHR